MNFIKNIFDTLSYIIPTPISPNDDVCTTADIENLELFGLVWLDSNVKEPRETEQQLRSIINRLKNFQDVKQCQQYIEERSENDRLVLIVSGRLGREIVPSIHKLRQVISIYVYCMDQKGNEEWALKFEKVKAVIVKLDELVSRIKSDHEIQKKVEEPLSMNIYTTNADKSTIGVHGEFVFFQVLIDCLLRLKSTDADKKELVKICQYSHEGNSTELGNIREFEQDYSSDKALWWYTKESFFYKTLNGALRTRNIDMMFLYRAFISDIHRQLQENQAKNCLQVYRSQKMSSDELKTLKQSIGQYISINSFLSTSTDEKQARSFLGVADKSSDLQRVLFKIHADPKMVTTKPFADISSLSFYSTEAEVLFMLGSIFHLQSVDRDPTDGHIWIIKMSLCGDDEHDLKNVLIYMKEQTGSGETNLQTLANVLWKMGKFNFAKKYLERFLQQLLPNDPLRGTLYEDLGNLTSQAGDFNTSVEWHQKSIEFKTENKLPTDPIVPTHQPSTQSLPSNERPCMNGVRCYNPNCRYWHPEERRICNERVQCINYECSDIHPPGRTQKCRNGNQCKNKGNCQFLHPTNQPNSPETRSSEIIELSDAKCDFLKRFGANIFYTIRKKPGITDRKFTDRKLWLSGHMTAIENVKSDLARILLEQNVTIALNLKKYLEIGNEHLMRKFLRKYQAGVSFNQTITHGSLTTEKMVTIKNNGENQENNDSNGNHLKDNDDDEDNDDDDDNKSVTSNASTSTTASFSNVKRGRQNDQKFIQVTLCSNSNDSLFKAVKELESYSLVSQSWSLTQDEIAYILKQPQKGKLPRKQSAKPNKPFQIKSYFIDFLRPIPNAIVLVFVKNRHGFMCVELKGFQNHVNNAEVKLKTYLADNVKTEVQLPISKAMAVFLRAKASSVIRNLERTSRIELIINPVLRDRHGNNKKENDKNNCLKLIGSNSHIDAAQANIENFLESLSEQEKQFPCQSWEISKNISEILRLRLRKLQESDDFDAIGRIKRYTAAEKRETEPNVAISIVGFNAEAVDGLTEQCQNIIEGYVIWKLSADDYRAIHSILIVKKSPPIQEFQKQWDTNIQLDPEMSTITIPGSSKEIADDIKEALLGLRVEKKPQMKRITEFIPIPLDSRRFVNQAINSVLDEARAHNVFIESKNRNGLKLQGRSDIVADIKQKINSIIDDIKQKIVTSRLQLFPDESDLLRANTYKIAVSIERKTNTIIWDVAATKRSSTLYTSDDADMNLVITSVVNSRSQMISVQKGDITKTKHINAIVNMAHGTLYHAGALNKAIFDAAGPALDEECKQLIIDNGGLPLATGEVVKTTAGNLPFKCIIHAVVPQFNNDDQEERHLLFSSILSSLRLAEKERCAIVALAAVNSDMVGFTLPDCTNIVVRAIKQFFADYPQSTMKEVILVDTNDTACDLFAHEVIVDHRNVLADDNDIANDQLLQLTAKWCCQTSDGEKIYDENHTCQIETEFQQYLKTFTESTLVISTDDLESDTILNYSIHFRSDLKQLLTSNPEALNGRLVCGHQISENTSYKHDLIRYPIAQNIQATTVSYFLTPLDLYSLETVTTKVDWVITSISTSAITQAEKRIRQVIDDAIISEPYSVNLDKESSKHREQIKNIATQQRIQINFQEDNAEQLSMILKGLKSNVQDAKLKIAIYSNDILKIQIENDELSIPKEWDDQQDNCNLVEINRNDPKFISIEKRMQETMSNVKIDKIERVQNVRMWSHYASRRQQLKKELCLTPNLEIEMELFYGTRTTPPHEVYNSEYGFDVTFNTSGPLGIGLYFYKNASYSCPNDSYESSNGRYQVFLAQVLTGDVYDCQQNNPNLRWPPKKNGSTSGLRYNSVSGDKDGSKVYIVYENRVAYPTYLITFTP